MRTTAATNQPIAATRWYWFTIGGQDYEVLAEFHWCQHPGVLDFDIDLDMWISTPEPPDERTHTELEQLLLEELEEFYPL